MTNIKNTTSTTEVWTSVQAYTLAVVCLLIGIAGGWFIRGSQTPSSGTQAAQTTPMGMAIGTGSQDSPTGKPSADQMRLMADQQAKPLLAQLKSDSNNAGLLANIGNIYYDTQLYPTAIEYYQRSLKIQPSNAGVRTDLATAFWYTGSADTAIEEFNKALSYEPNKSNTLFNLGIVKWQGKMDVNGAVAAWQKLLDTNPDYEAKDKVVQLMAQAKKHANVKPGTAEKPLSQ
ncbi:MAG TPA: tetratricopeptide repeat protein [Terriglobales bacterium]|nr:tetratricopeptide repeat protein [Terriglobales bacterium]